MMRGHLTPAGSDWVLSAALHPDTAVSYNGLYLALTGRVATDSDDGDALDEPLESAGYVRAFYPLGDGWWTASGIDSYRNVDRIVFPVATEPWDTVQGFAWCTSVTGGDVLAIGRSGAARVNIGEQVIVGPLAMAISIRGSVR